MSDSCEDEEHPRIETDVCVNDEQRYKFKREADRVGIPSALIGVMDEYLAEYVYLEADDDEVSFWSRTQYSEIVMKQALLRWIARERGEAEIYTCESDDAYDLFVEYCSQSYKCRMPTILQTALTIRVDDHRSNYDVWYVSEYGVYYAFREGWTFERYSPHRDSDRAMTLFSEPS